MFGTAPIIKKDSPQVKVNHLQMPNEHASQVKKVSYGPFFLPQQHLQNPRIAQLWPLVATLKSCEPPGHARTNGTRLQQKSQQDVIKSLWSWSLNLSSWNLNQIYWTIAAGCSRNFRSCLRQVHLSSVPPAVRLDLSPVFGIALFRKVMMIDSCSRKICFRLLLLDWFLVEWSG